MKKSVADQVRRQIKRAGEGSLFLVGDFANIGSRDAITRTLSRLAHEGTIRRL